MDEAPARAPSSRPRTRRFRLGLRGLMILILGLGLALGWIARQAREFREQTRFVAELQRDGIRVIHAEPTPFGLFLTGILATDGVRLERRFERWLGPCCFSRPRGFNAGRLKEERVAPVVEQLSRLGPVWEVTYTSPSRKGLKLFYIDRVRYNNLGPDGNTCIIERHPAAPMAREDRSSADGRGTPR